MRLKLAELESNQEGPKQKARLRRAATQRAKQMKVYYVNDLSSDSETGILKNIFGDSDIGDIVMLVTSLCW